MAERNKRCTPFLWNGWIAFLLLIPAFGQKQLPPPSRFATQGTLYLTDRLGQPVGECPLQHTSVTADVTGFLSRVTVTQDFVNRSSDKVEAVYTFPLPHDAAVDDMLMEIGMRRIRGVMRRREEARQIFEQARQRGQTAALLDQERPNIFTQSVTNIAPGAKVRITLSYLQALPYEEARYEFTFPMVVGPRYIPGQASGSRSGGGWAPDTAQVPDASRITPPVTPPGTRAGHDIDIEVRIDAGMPIRDISSPSHRIATDSREPGKAIVRLQDLATIPNKDFILRYQLASGTIGDALFVTRGTRGGFFALMVQPPERPAVESITPKELVFVLDTSGSMSGPPIEKAKETMRLALSGLYPHDTFNLITFAGDTHILFPEPVPATPGNLRQADSFLASRQGSGGTEMMKAIRAALQPSGEAGKIRIVCFMTDGYVGNDMEIVGEVRRHPNARVFSFGIGNSVNRFLLDRMARESRGEVDYVSLSEDGGKAARKFHERIRQPLLTDIQLDFSWLPAADVQPSRLPDLFAAKPLLVTGRFTAPARGVVRMTGRQGLRNFTRSILVEFPASEPKHEALAALWARHRVEELSAEDWGGLPSGSLRPELREQITSLGLEFRIMTPFTSFIAVEEQTVHEGGIPRQVLVPVEMPDGVSYEGVFGTTSKDAAVPPASTSPMMSFAPVKMAAAIGGVFGSPRQENRMEVTSADKEANRPAREESKAKLDSSRVHPRVQTWLEEAGKGAAAREVEVEIRLSSAAPEVLAELKKNGFRMQYAAPGALRIVGRVAAAQLQALLRLKEVVFIGPAPAPAGIR